MSRRIVRSRRRPDRAAFGTYNANALDLAAAHRDERRRGVGAEGTWAEIYRIHLVTFGAVNGWLGYRLPAAKAAI